MNGYLLQCSYEAHAAELNRHQGTGFDGGIVEIFINQCRGGNGYTRSWPLEKYLRDARVLQVCEGTDQIQRLIIRL